MKRKIIAIVALLVTGLVAALVFISMRANPGPKSPDVQVPVSWQTARAVDGHAKHVKDKKIACAECHGSNFDAKPSETTCAKTSCHVQASAHAHMGTADKPTGCVNCHAFGQKTEPKACNTCHAPVQPGNANASTHLSASVDCRGCHDLHGPSGARALLSDCRTCHVVSGAKHGHFEITALDAGAPPAAIASPFGAGDAGAAEQFRGTAPVGLGMFAPISPDAGTTRTTQAGVGPGSPASLPGPVCASCHLPHAPKIAARSACVLCHVTPAKEGAKLDQVLGVRAGPGFAALAKAAPRVALGGKNVAGHEACTTCHSPHDARKGSVRACESCHQDHNAALGAKGHTACTTCHTPHAPSQAKASCASCHEGKSVLGASHNGSHAACGNCHDLHKPSTPPSAACAKCHASVNAEHPKTLAHAGKGALESCTGCHQPHPAKTGAVSAACSTCHTSAKSDHSHHAASLTCASCHKAHAFKLAPGDKALCASCHSKQAGAVAAQPGHAACAACHGATHRPVASPGCASCHAQEVATAPKGHAACGSCHDAHSGKLATAATTCTNCHQDKVKGKALHANVAGGCASCHRPHGPKGVPAPPACATCHAPSKLPGLHQKPSHAANCANCHGGHAPPRSDRAACTTQCHQDRRTHQPEAAVCKGCHIFKM